jgi:enediyne biosynthesis protein E4
MKGTQYIFIALLYLISCKTEKEQQQPQEKKETLFRFLSSDESGVKFQNTIMENDSIYILDNYYMYNGAGLGMGDFNNDGLPDMIFAGSMVESKLYLNQGKLKFKDVTEASGIHTKNWMTGVSVVDLDGNGWQDIFISSGVACEFGCRSLLFMNQGIDSTGTPKFKEEGAAIGLSDTTHVTQVAFFDYDRDGDLDAYLLKNIVDGVNKSVIQKPDFYPTKSHTDDRLLRNNGVKNGTLSFTDVSKKAGIDLGGYGLGIAISDLNSDGWPDVYVANDFSPNDLLFINQKDGTFKDMKHECLSHHSFNGMGCDIADINNDGKFDIMVMDMLPEDNKRQKTMLFGPNENEHRKRLGLGYQAQFIRNTLQLNNGVDASGNALPFSEVAQLSGVSKTDWSWAPIMMDFDNDGNRDIYITNGFVKDMTDLDFINNKKFATRFGTKEAQWQQLKDLYSKLDGAYLSNYMYANNGNLTFEDVTNKWGIEKSSYSNGVAYADLDLDGDLDLLVNNINAEAFVIESRVSELTKNHFARIKLKGTKLNPSAIGATVKLYQGADIQSHYQSLVRGYLSSVEDVIHFGLGKRNSIDSIEVIWPTGELQKVYKPQIDTTITITMLGKLKKDVIKKKNPFLSKIKIKGLDFKSKEEYQNDFAAEPLMLNMYSQNGSCLAAADIDGILGDELFIGTPAGQKSKIYYQALDGTFKVEEIPNSEQYDDVDAIWFDFDNDKDQDLYVVSGGGSFQDGDGHNLDRLYINNGGKLTYAPDLLPKNMFNGSVVTSGDVDGDGDLDLFVGGGVKVGQYPKASTSSILINDNGRLNLADQNQQEELLQLGIVNAATLCDFDGDKWLDLVAVGEWMDITFYRNDHTGHLVKFDTKLKDTNGWWYSVKPIDLDKDGDIDFAVGNIGLNTPFLAGSQYPFRLYLNDFDNNQAKDLVFSTYLKDTTGVLKEFPYHAFDPIASRINGMKARFRKHMEYARVSITNLFNEKLLKESQLYELNQPQSGWLVNNSGSYTFQPFDINLQKSSINEMEFFDVNGDGYEDIILAGNMRASENIGGWYDASIGDVLLNDGKGKFKRAEPSATGLLLKGDVKGLAKMKINKVGEVLVASEYNSNLSIYGKSNKLK